MKRISELLQIAVIRQTGVEEQIECFKILQRVAAATLTEFPEM